MTMNNVFYGRLVTTVRLLLGTVFVVNGLNWWVKLITPYPSISDPVSMPPQDFVAAMIATGLLFHVVKAVELLAGIALLANRFVPLALVAVVPVTFNVFLVDVFLHHRLRAFIMGSGAFVMNGYLMLAYLQHYRGMLVGRASPDGELGAAIPGGAPLAGLRTLLGVLSALVGFVMVAWLIVLLAQHFTQ